MARRSRGSRAAHTAIVGAGEYEIFVVCAEDGLKMRLTVSMYDEQVDVNRTGCDDTRRFSLLFPTGVLHAGDAFGNVINLDFPETGTYTVVLRPRRTREAAATFRREWPGAAELPVDQAREVLDRWAGIERYQVTVFPA